MKNVNMAGLMMMGIAMIFLAVGFIIYPVLLDGTDGILAYANSACASLTDASFTGLTAVTGVLPLIALLGYVTAAVISGFMGVKMLKTGSGSMNPVGIMMLGLGQIFIAVGLIIFPVVLDGCCTILLNASLATYTGLESVTKVVPLIVLVAFISGGIVTQYFGYTASKKSAA